MIGLTRKLLNVIQIHKCSAPSLECVYFVIQYSFRFIHSPKLMYNATNVKKKKWFLKYEILERSLETINNATEHAPLLKLLKRITRELPITRK